MDITGNGGGPMDPVGIAFHDGNLYVASQFVSEVKEFDGTMGAFVSTFVTSGSGGLSGPTAVAFGPDRPLLGTIYLVMAMSFMPNAIWESWPFSWRIVPPPALPCGGNWNGKCCGPKTKVRANRFQKNLPRLAR